MGLLERWYVAHSRAGHHTGFSVAMELETSNDAAAVYLVGPQVVINVSPECSLNKIEAAYQTKVKAARSAARMDMGLCKLLPRTGLSSPKRMPIENPTVEKIVSKFPISAMCPLTLRFNKVGTSNVTGPALTLTMVTSVGGLKTVLSAVPQAFTRDSLVEIGKSFQTELLSFRAR